MREWGVRIDVVVPEPNTWRDLLMAVEQSMSLSGKTVAIQEYGVPNAELARGLESLGGNVVTVPVYRWALPVDTAPLRAAVRATIAGEVDVLMFTSAQQFHHVLMIADEEGGRDAWLAAARRCVVASIGPTATETLTAGGLAPDIEPEHPKMGHLVLAAAREAREILRAKREGSAQRPKF
jgi:uroporphyrinogen-III synthase